MIKAYLSELTKYLILHTTIRSTDILTTENIREYITAFQSQSKLPLTGITDRDTLWALQFPIAIENQEYSIKTINVDTSPDFDCLPSFHVRNDCYSTLMNAFEQIHNLGGQIFSSGSLRPLDAPISSGRSPTSLHYTGLAIDFCINAGFHRPEIDPYVVVRERFDKNTKNWNHHDSYFCIYCRSPKGVLKKVNAIYWYSHRSGQDLFYEIEDKFICLTDIMKQNGFLTIPPRSGFLRKKKRSYLASEWWHFNAQQNIIKGFSQFGIELIKTFGYKKVKNSPVWKSRKAIYNNSGFILANYIDVIKS